MKIYRHPGKLAQLHETFIDRAHRPMSFSDTPLKAKEPAPIVVPATRWEFRHDPNFLVKSFQFRRGEDRIRFVTELLEYEFSVHHHAEMLVTEDQVSIKLVTKNIEQVTERDREYSLFADSVFKDIVYSV